MILSKIKTFETRNVLQQFTSAQRKKRNDSNEKPSFEHKTIQRTESKRIRNARLPLKHLKTQEWEREREIKTKSERERERITDRRERRERIEKRERGGLKPVSCKTKKGEARPRWWRIERSPSLHFTLSPRISPPTYLRMGPGVAEVIFFPAVVDSAKIMSPFKRSFSDWHVLDSCSVCNLFEPVEKYLSSFYATGFTAALKKVFERSIFAACNFETT